MILDSCVKETWWDTPPVRRDSRAKREGSENHGKLQETRRDHAEGDLTLLAGGSAGIAVRKSPDIADVF